MRDDPVRHRGAIDGSESSARRAARAALLGAAAVAVVAASCAAPSQPEDSAPAERCADVIAATIEPSSGRFDVTATVRSADTGWERYADEWNVRTESGDVLGTRTLAHPHVDEQPFTRSLRGVSIPASVASVVVAARDSVVGYCGATVTVDVPHP